MLALTWTLFAALAVILTATQWIAQALASGTAAQATRDLAALPLPAWLESWVDPAWLQPLHAGLQWAIESTAAVLPLAGTAAGWLVPAVWVVWGLGARTPRLPDYDSNCFPQLLKQRYTCLM